MASFSSELQAMADEMKEIKKQNSSLIQKLWAMEITIQDVKEENGSLREKQADMERKVSAMEITMQEVKRENECLRDKQANMENEHGKRIQKLESDHQMVARTKRVWGRSLVLAQAEAEMKTKLSHRESATAQTTATAPIGATVPTRAAVPTRATAPIGATVPTRAAASTRATAPIGATVPTRAAASSRATAPIGATVPTRAKAQTAATTVPTRAAASTRATAPIGATVPTRAAASTRATAQTGTTAPTERTKEEIKNIKHQSKFRVYKSLFSPAFRVPRDPTLTPIEGYDWTWRRSPYFDVTTGIFTVPLKGKCRFWVRDDGVEGTGSLDWFMCRGDGRRERMTGREGFGGYLCDDVEWECEEGDKVWVEGMGVEGDVMVKGVEFRGWMLD